MVGITEPALRFAHYAALLGLFGWTAFRLIGLRGLDWVPQGRGYAALIGAGISAPLLSLALMLASIAAMMGVPVAALDLPMTEAMILGTDLGWAFIVRAVLLVTGFSALLVMHRIRSGFPIAAACYGGALMTLGWSGHAAANAGGMGLFHRLNNGIHLLAAGLWLGAIGWFLYLVITAHRKPNDIPLRRLFAVMHRFAPFGVGLVGVVSVTGLFNADLIFGLENSVAVLSTGYGILLAGKIALVGGMVGFGARNASVGRGHRLINDQATDASGATLANLRRSLAGEISLAIIVTGLVAVFGMLSPTPM